MEPVIVKRILENILINDNQIRKEAESLLLELKKDLPNLLISLIQIPLSESNNNIKMLALILTRKLLHQTESTQDSKVWMTLSPDQKQFMKKGILEAFKNENNRPVKNKILDLIPILLDNIKENEEDWPELLELIGLFLNSQLQLPPFVIESYLLLIRNMFFHYQEDFIQNMPKLIELLDQAFAFADFGVKAKAVNLMEELVYTLPKKELAQVKCFGKQILETAFLAFKAEKEDLLKNCLINISDINLCNPNFLRKNMAEMFELFESIVSYKNFADEFIKEVAFTMIQDITKKSFKSFKMDQARTKRYMERLVLYGVSLQDEVTENWCNPKLTNYSEEQYIEEEELSLAICYLDDFLKKIDTKVYYEFLTGLVQMLLENSNWVYKYVGLLFLGKLSFHFDWDKIKPVVPVVFAFINHENPKIRFAVFNFISEMSENYDFADYEEFSEDIIRIIISSLNDPVLRVRLEAFDALQILIETADMEFTVRHLQLIVDTTTKIFIDITIPLNLRESILRTIEGIISATGNDFNDYAVNCLAIFLQFFQQSHNQPGYKEINGSIINLILQLAEICPVEFASSTKEFVTLFLALIESIPNSTDPIYSNFEDAWDTLVPIVKTNCPEMLEPILNNVISLVEYIPNIVQKSNNENDINIDEILKEDNEEDGQDINTLKTQEICFMVEQLGNIAKSLETDFFPYIEKSESILIPLLNFNSNSSVRCESAQALATFVEILATASNSATVVKAKHYLSMILMSCENENDFPCLSEKFDSLSEILKHSPAFLDSNEIFEFFSKCLFHLGRIENVFDKLNRKKELVEADIEADDGKLNESDDQDDDDDSVVDSIAEDIEETNTSAKTIVDSMGSAYLKHGERCVPVVNKLMEELVKVKFENDLSLFKKINYVQMAVDMAEFLKQETIPQFWKDIAEIFLIYSSHNEEELSQSSIYGIGILPSTTSTGYEEILYPSLKAIKEAIIKNSDEKGNKLTRDYAVSALGKIVYNKGSIIQELDECICYWLQLLPLKCESAEGKDNLKLLLDLTKNSFAVLLGENYKNSNLLIGTLINCFKSKSSDLELNNEIRNLFQTMEADPITLQLLEQASKQFTIEQVSKVKQIKVK